MYILNRRNAAFIAHPRTASRACSKAILAAGASTVNGHHRLNETKCRKIVESGGVVACVTRNMFDVLVSWWHNQNFQPGSDKSLKHEVQPFDKFLREKAYTTTHRWFMDPVYHYGLRLSNWVLRYETLSVDMADFFRKIGEQPHALPVIGASKRTDYHDYYTPELRAIVEDRWAEDLILTGYEF